MTEPQFGATYETLLRHAQHTESLGFTGWFRSDHYLTMGGDGLPGPTDAWTTLAGLARETERVRLGTLVSSVTYRPAGILAIQVAQVDAMSGGRVELGLGTGWFEAEHRAYGIPFPPKRFGMLAEHLEVVSSLWALPVGETYSFAGDFVTVEDSPGLPKPVQARIPIIVGGMGTARTPALAARFATEYNANWADEAELAAQFGRIDAACDAIGRERGDLRRSTAQQAVVGRTEADYLARAEALRVDAAAHRANHLGGTPSEIADRVAAYAELGVARVYLQVLDLTDLDLLDTLAEALL